MFDVDESGTVGFSCAGGLKVAVEISEEELQPVKRYLIESDRTQDDAEDLAFKQVIQWYGIVDGIHMHRAAFQILKIRDLIHFKILNGRLLLQNDSP